MAESIRGINVVIGADTTGLSKALSDVNKKSRDIQSELKQVERLLKLDPKNTELLAQKQQLLSQAVENTREKLDRLRSVQEQVNEQFQRGEISEGQYRAFQREVAKTEQELKKLETQLKGMEPAVKSLGERMEEAGEKMKKAGESMTNVGKKLSVGVTAPLVAVGGAAVAAANEFDKAMATIVTSTGASGEALQTLENDLKAVYENVPTSVEAAAGAIANLNTLLGASGPVLQDVAKNVLEVSRIMGEDGVANSHAFGKAMQQWEIPAEDAVGVMDRLFKVTQDTGIGFGELTNQLNAYGPVLKNAGFTIEETAELMGRLNAAGISWSRISPGLNAAFRRWADEGKNLREEFAGVVEAIKNAETSTEALTIATDAFGAQGAQRLTTAIRQGALSLDDLGAALQNVDGLIENTAAEAMTLGDHMTLLKNQATSAIEPLGESLVAALVSLIEAAQPLIEIVKSLFQWFANLDEGTQRTIVIIAGLTAAIGPLLVVLGKVVSSVGALMPVLAALTNPIGLVVAAVAGLVAGLVVLYNKNETVRNALNSAWEWLKSVAEAIFGAIRAFWSEWGDEIVAIFETCFEILKTVWNTVFETISGVVKSIFDDLRAFWDRWGNMITTYFRGLWNNIKIVFETVLGVIKGIVDFWLAAFRGDWEGAWEAVKNIVSTIWDGIKRIFANSFETMKQIGKDIIQGLIDGIGNMAQAVWEKARSIASSISSAITGFFGIRSPSRLMIGFGEDIAEGLVVGMQHGIADVKKQASALSAAANISASGTLGGRGGAGSIVVNVTGNTITSPADEDRLAEKISRKIAGAYGLSSGGAW